MQKKTTLDAIGRTVLILSCLLAAFPSTSTVAGNAPRVEILRDLVELFHEATPTNCSACQLRQPGVAAGVGRNAIFEHPAAPGQPARLEYWVALQAIGPGELLVLSFATALADGIELNRADGVGFGIEVEGQPCFARTVHECRWRSGTVDLSAWAGRTVKLVLVVNALGNTSYDWAMWGEPRILRFSGATEVQVAGAGKITIPFSHGAVLAPPAVTNRVKMRLSVAGSTRAQEWIMEPGPAKSVEIFGFRKAERLELQWDPADALNPGQLMVAPFPPELRIRQISPTRAVIKASEQCSLRARIENRGSGTLEAGTASAHLEVQSTGGPGAQLPPKPLGRLDPGEEVECDWDWSAPTLGGECVATAWVNERDPTNSKSTSFVLLQGPLQTNSISNDRLRIEFVRDSGGYAYANVLGKATNWVPVAHWAPLFQVALDRNGRIEFWRPRVMTFYKGSSAAMQTAQLAGKVRDPDGIEWNLSLELELRAGEGSAQLRYGWEPAQAREVRSLLGPNIYVGDGAAGAAKHWGLFPGLEYLVGPERSSNPRDFVPALADRRMPHPHKITIPLMAVTTGPNCPKPPSQAGRFFAPDSLKDGSAFMGAETGKGPELTVALSWDPLQQWDGKHAFPSAHFASPNLGQGMDNHRLALLLPSVPGEIEENAEVANKPWRVPAGKQLTLQSKLLVLPGPATAAVREWCSAQGGLPKPNAWPRSFQEELDLCRTGFLRTVWDPGSQKWRHCIGWAPDHSPGYASLLWLDAQATSNAQARRESLNRVELVVTNMLREGGPGLFSSQAGCHIMQWEFPFLYGYLAESMPAVQKHARSLIRGQTSEGGWLYRPSNSQQADLGQAGDSVLGTCASPAAYLLRYARITGDPEAIEAGKKALRFMERFRVPRGGQTWECPMYEPDILAAAYAIRAYHDGYRITGDPRWLQDAVYWAESGLPFVYLWSLGDKPMMLGSTIPVFGSTFYTHTWLAVPVQWCGLVYAYHVFHLGQELEQHPLGTGSSVSPLPVTLNFTAAQWRRVVELITVSATWQQFPDGENAGCYPDSISRFEQRNPAFINPEDIMLNVLALNGHDPDVKTARLQRASGPVVLSSGADISEVRDLEHGVAFRLRSFHGQPSHSLMSGLAVRARAVRVNGKDLAELAEPPRRNAGWWWDATNRRIYITVNSGGGGELIELIER